MPWQPMDALRCCAWEYEIRQGLLYRRAENACVRGKELVWAIAMHSVAEAALWGHDFAVVLGDHTL